MTVSGRYEEEFPAMRRDAYRAAYGVLCDRQAAEDAASEALAQAWVHWSRIGDLPYRTAWLRRVAINAALKILKKQRRLTPITDPRMAAFDEHIAIRLALSEALLELPSRQREVLALRYLADLPEADVAAAMGISNNSVKTHLKRGLATLRKRIDAKEVIADVSVALA